MQDTTYRWALRFITSVKALPHHLLYAQVGWSAFSTRRIAKRWHFLVLIYLWFNLLQRSMGK